MKIKEVIDKRGFSIFFEDFPLNEFHMVSMNPGAIRGNHTHDYTEIICVLGGKEVARVSLESSEGSEQFVIDKEFEVVEVSPGIRHIVENVGNKVFYLVCFALK